MGGFISNYFSITKKSNCSCSFNLIPTVSPSSLGCLPVSVYEGYSSIFLLVDINHIYSLSQLLELFRNVLQTVGIYYVAFTSDCLFRSKIRIMAEDSSQEPLFTKSSFYTLTSLLQLFMPPFPRAYLLLQSLTNSKQFTVVPLLNNIIQIMCS